VDCARAAAHLAGRLEVLIAAIRSDDRSSPGALMRAQASLRLFDRLLTLESVDAQLGAEFDQPVECEVNHGAVEADDDDEEDE